jgi:hypothetical protein
MKLKNCFLIAILAFVCSAAPASASVIKYTSLAAFNAAISGMTTYNFEGIAPANDPVNGWTQGNPNVVVGPVTGPVTFAPDSSGTLWVFGDNYYANTFGGAAFISAQEGLVNGSNNVTATLAPGVTAIGFSYGPADAAGEAITVTINGSGSYNLAIPAVFATADFVGFTSDTPITSVAFTEQGLGMDIIQFELGTANPAVSPAPEPASMLLLGLGLMGLAGVRRKIKK